MTKNSIIGTIILLAVGISLIFWSKVQSPTYSVVKTWNDGGVKCLPDGHQNLAQHIHPRLTVLVGTTSEAIPENIGITKDCMAEVHTHDETGVLHIETVTMKEMRFKDFVIVWGKTLSREGYSIKVTINEKEIVGEAEILDTVLKDGQIIKIEYTKLP